MDHRVHARGAARLEVLLHAAKDLAEDLLALRAAEGLAKLLVGDGRDRPRHLLRIERRQIGSTGYVLRLGHLLLLSHWIRAPEIAREITSRWISDVPSKIV